MRSDPRRRRRFPRWLLFLAFIVIPLVEIYIVIQVGQVIGALWTILLLVADSLFGAWLVKREGGRAWRALRNALNQGRMPSTELADGMLILIGGTLMLTPGFVTDVLGMLMILPPTRPLGRGLLAGFITRRLGAGTVGGAAYGYARRTSPGDPGPVRDPARGSAEDVVRGEVID